MNVEGKSKETGARVTSLDVARRARVSQSAVSRTFNPSGSPGSSVSSATRDKVLKAAAELGYQPNIIARSLITGRTGMVGVVISDLANPYHPLLLDTLTKQLQDSGRHALLFTVPTDGDVDELLPRLLQYQVDAIVIASGTLSSIMADVCRRRETPVILLNRVAGPGVDSIQCDNPGGGAMAARALVEAGCQRIALVGGRRNVFTHDTRREGFLAGLVELGVEPVAEMLGQFTYDGGAEAARELLSRPAGERPDGIFCANDFMAFGLLDVARHELGLSVPNELSVIGFDDVPEAGRPTYELATIRESAEALAAAVVARLEQGQEDVQTGVGPIVVPVELIRRSSLKSPHTPGAS